MTRKRWIVPLCLALPCFGGAPGQPSSDPGVADGPVTLPMWRGREMVAAAAGPAPRQGKAVPAGLRRRALLEQVISPSADWLARAGVVSGWPGGARLEDTLETGDALMVRLSLPDSFLLGGGVTEEWLENASRQLLAVLQSDPGAPARLHLAVRDPGSPDHRWTALSAFLPKFDPAAIVKERVAEPPSSQPPSSAPLTRRVRPVSGEMPDVAAGALSGKQVFLSQCHGWIDYNDADAWETQRGITNSLVEDFVNPEGANAYLVRYLENAGATVWTLRESDTNPNLVIVDSADGSAFPANGTYVESGSGAAFSTGPSDSFGNFAAPYTSTQDPLRKAGNKDRLIAVSATETARATWTPNIPVEGDYEVYLSYTRNGTARASDAHFIVNHTGGASHFRVNQERHGWVWVRLGWFHFAAGSNPATGSVVLANDSAEAGNTVSADAVRFGGGMGDIQGEFHPTVSTHPRWEEGARYFIQYQGSDSSVWGAGDVTGRSKFAAWENYGGIEDSVFVSWHSNAFDTTARGTTSYVYSANPPDGTYDPTQAVAGSDALMRSIHDELINDIRAGWDPAWQNRGYKSAYFGEINPNNNSEMPSTLLEVAFHDNATDALQLSDPKFRRLLSRSIYQGIVKYFAARDAIAPRLLPEPPREPEAHSLDRASVMLTWLAPVVDGTGLAGDAATGYRIHHSTDGYGFDDGVDTAATSITLGGYLPGSVHYFRIASLNPGGESLPSETLAVRLPAALEPKVLIVNGFDRLERSQLIPRSEPDLGGSVLRMELVHMNDFSYAVRHGKAIGAAGLAFDDAANEAVASGRVALAPATAKAIDWISGTESTADESFSSTEQSRVQTYMASGGRLFASGAEIGWDLDWLGSAADRSFYQSSLGSNYVADDAGVYAASGAAGSILAGVTSITFDDGTGGSYPVEYPDVVSPVSPGLLCVNYTGPGTGAGVQRDTGTWRSVAFGFPFESILLPAKRDEVMKKVMDWLIPCAAPAQPLTIPAAGKNGAVVSLTVTDPNPAASVTGYDLVRSASASPLPTGWGALVNNGVDQDGAVAGIQLLDATGAAPPGGAWFYELRARNDRCGSLGPY